MMDYVAWRGDLDFAASPFNDVDALIFASIAYVDMPDAAADADLTLREVQAMLPPPPEPGWRTPFFCQCRLLLDAVADTPRFGEVRVHSFVNEVDPQRDIQFSAVNLDLPDGTRFVAFRGTDYSIVGWREDFTMAFESPVPAQAAAVPYLAEAARDGRPLRTGGHSKGGNLALYASAHSAPDVQSRIMQVYTFDGPGLDDATFVSEGYARVRGKVRSYIPQSAVVGLLLAQHEDYVVVRANALGVLQHDAFTWQLKGTQFLTVGNVDLASQLVDRTVHAWLTTCTPEQRRVFVNTLFDMLEATHATTLKELVSNVRGNLGAIISAARAVDKETLRMVARLLGRMVRLGATTLVDILTDRMEENQQNTDERNRRVINEGS